MQFYLQTQREPDWIYNGMQCKETTPDKRLPLHKAVARNSFLVYKEIKFLWKVFILSLNWHLKAKL